MSIMKWNPLKDLITMQENMNKIFDNAVKDAQGEWSPKVDIIENDENIILLVELPGVLEDQMEIQVANGILSLKGEKKSPEPDDISEYFYRQECAYGKFCRNFAIPSSIDTSKVKAKLKDGILKIVLIKSNQTIKTTIKVETE